MENLLPIVVPAKVASSLLSISRPQFAKLYASGKIPDPIRLGVRAPRWRIKELEAWVQAGCPDREHWRDHNAVGMQQECSGDAVGMGEKKDQDLGIADQNLENKDQDLEIADQNLEV